MNRTACRLILVCVTTCCVVAPALAAPPTDEAARELQRAKRDAEKSPDDPDVIERLANFSQRAGGLGKLVSEYTQRADASPSDGGLRLIAAELLRLAGRCPDAVGAYQKAAELLPRSPTPWAGIGECHRTDERWAPAIDAFTRAADLARGKDAVARVNRQLLDTALAANQPEPARKAHAAIIATAPRDRFLRVDLARKLSGSTMPELAREAWTDLLDMAGSDQKLEVLAVRELGRVLTRLGKGDEAIERYRKVLARLPAEHWAVFDLQEGLIGVYRSQGRLQEYIAELEKRRSSYPILLLLARLYEETGADDKALQAYRTAVKQRPANVDAQAALLRILKRVGTRDELVAEYKRLSRALRGEPRYDLELAELLLREGDTKQGFALLDKVGRRFPQDPGVFQITAELLVQYGGPRAKIEKAFDTLIRLEPDDESHLSALGEYYFGQNERAKAIATWNRILKTMRNAGRAHLTLARLFAEHEMPDEALQHYQQAIKAKPEDLRYLKTFATFLERIHRYKDAAQTWQQVLSLLPEEAFEDRREARAHIVSLHDQQQLLTVRESGWRRDFEATPPDIEAGLYLSQSLIYRKDFGAAATALERIVTARPKQLEALLLLEDVYEKLNRLPDAIKMLQRIADLDKSMARSRLQKMARLSMELHNRADALRYARLVVDLGPNDPEAQAHLGEILSQAGRHDEALVAYRKSLALRPGDIAVQFKLVAALEAVGRSDELARALMDVVRTAKDGSDVLTAGRRLLALPSMSALEAFEPILLRETFKNPKRRVYHELLIDLYATMVKRLQFDADRDPGLTRAKLDAIGRRGLKPIIDALGSQNLAVRSRALDILVAVRAPGAVPPLTRLLGEPDPLVRFQALVALAHIGVPSAIEPIARLITERSRKDIGPAAIWALGAFPQKAAGLALANADTAKDGRADARRIVQLLAQGVRGRSEGFASARNTFEGGGPLTRPFAAWSLGAMGDRRAARSLIDRLPLETGLTRRTIIWSLGALAAPDALVPLLREVWGRDVELVPLALWAVGRVMSGDRIDRTALRERYLSLYDVGEQGLKLGNALAILTPTPGESRPDTARLLQRHETQVRQALVEQLGAGEPSVSLRTIAALGRGETPSLWPLAEVPVPVSWFPALREATHRHDHSPLESVRAEALGLLHRLGETDPKHLVGALDDSSDIVRRSAAIALGAGYPNAAPAPLTTALRAGKLQNHWTGRVAACRGLALAVGQTPTAGPVEDAVLAVITRLVADEYPAVRREALVLAQALGPRAAAVDDAIIARLNDGDPDVVLAAIAAAGALGTSRARGALEAIKTPDPKLKASIRAALARR